MTRHELEPSTLQAFRRYQTADEQPSGFGMLLVAFGLAVAFWKFGATGWVPTLVLLVAIFAASGVLLDALSEWKEAAGMLVVASVKVLLLLGFLWLLVIGLLASVGVNVGF